MTDTYFVRSDGLRVFVNQVPNMKDPGGSLSVELTPTAKVPLLESTR